MSVFGSPLRGISADTMREIVSHAFQQWTSVDCASVGPPSFQVDIFPDVSCTDVQGANAYKTQGPNYNLWIFQDDSWDSTDTSTESAIAITSVEFDPNTGEIFDADVALNSFGNNFTTDPTNVDIDLPSVVQHESGHFLGLAHSAAPTAAMWPVLTAGTTRLRTLDPDDVDGICAVYPPGHLDPTCDPEPRHGFSSTCDFASRGCAIAPVIAMQNRGGSRVAALGLLLLVATCRRRTCRVAARGIPGGR
jgi:hypothetical protein